MEEQVSGVSARFRIRQLQTGRAIEIAGLNIDGPTASLCQSVFHVCATSESRLTRVGMDKPTLND